MKIAVAIMVLVLAVLSSYAPIELTRCIVIWRRQYTEIPEAGMFLNLDGEILFIWMTFCIAWALAGALIYKLARDRR